MKRLYPEGDCFHVISAARRRLNVFADPINAQILVSALHFVRRDRAYLLAYAIMPDHLHAVIAPRRPYSLSSIMHSIKGYSARRINANLGRRGPLWQQSFYDRAIRDEDHLAEVIEYVHHNPVLADLVDHPEEYRFSSARDASLLDLELFLGG
jgi:REP element-mobilizing transposase RayT